MFGYMLLFLYFPLSVISLTEDEMNKAILTPAYLSDFINSRQIRNLTVIGHNEIKPIDGKYFTKPMFNLIQSLQPTFLTLSSMFFTNFDGMIVKGDARGLARFADVFVYDCNFKDGYAGVISIKGPNSENSPEDLRGD